MWYVWVNFGISLDIFEFLRFGWFFPFFKKIGFLGILGPPGNHASRWISDFWSKRVIANFGIPLDVFEFLRFGWFLLFFKKIGFWDILDPPSYGFGATIRIGREMLCLPYAGFCSSCSCLFNSICKKGITQWTFLSKVT